MEFSVEGQFSGEDIPENDAAALECPTASSDDAELGGEVNQVASNQTTTTTGIQYGRRYPIHISNEDKLTLQYIFKPKTTDISRPGSLDINSLNQVSLELHSNQDNGPIRFQGSSSTSTDIMNERLLMFDSKNECFHLSRISCAVLNVNVIRDEKTFSNVIAAKVTNHMSKASTVENFLRKRKQTEKVLSNQKSKKVKTDSSKSESNEASKAPDDTTNQQDKA